MKKLLFFGWLFVCCSCTCLYGQVQTLSKQYVTWYGAKGDGVVNDTFAVQKAIDSNAGGTVIFPVGVYKITSTLTNIANNTKLLGLGSGKLYETDAFYTRSATVLYFPTNCTNGISYTSTYGVGQTNNYTDIENITIDGNSSLDTGIKMNGTHRLRGVTITGCNQQGLLFYAKYNGANQGTMVNSIAVDDCSFIYNRDGNGLTVDSQDAPGLITPYHFRNCIFRGNNHGAYITAGYLSTFESCVFEQNIYEGVKISKVGTGQTLNNLIFRDCWWELNGNGLSGTNAASLTITGETASDNGSARGTTFDNCFFMMSSANVDAHIFNLQIALLTDFNHCVYYGGGVGSPFQFGPYVNTVRYGGNIQAWNFPGIQSKVISDITGFLDTAPLSIGTGYQTLEGGFFADTDTQGYGGGFRGDTTYLLGSGFSFYSRNNFVETKRLQMDYEGSLSVGTTANPGAIRIPYNADYKAAPISGSSIYGGSTALQIVSLDSSGNAKPIILGGSYVQTPSLIAADITTDTIIGDTAVTGDLYANTVDALNSVSVPFRTFAYNLPSNGVALVSGNSAGWVVSQDTNGAFAPLRLKGSTLSFESDINQDDGVYNLGNPGNRFKDGNFSGTLKSVTAVSDHDYSFAYTIYGASSGYTTLSVPNAAGTLSLVLPNTAGNAGDVLQTDGAGTLTWIPQSSSGTNGGITSINGSTNASQTITAGPGASVATVGATTTIGLSAATLTRGTGLTGSNYDVSAPVTWAVDLGSSSTQAAPGNHVHTDLTPGTGLTGTTYNGGTARTFSVDLGTSHTQAAYGDHTHTGLGYGSYQSISTTTSSGSVNLTPSSATVQIVKASGVDYFLPDASISLGKIFTFKIGTTTITGPTITAYAGQDIDGTSPLNPSLDALSARSITIISDGLAWYIMSVYQYP